MSEKRSTKYIIVFIITAVIFGSAFELSNYLANKKVAAVQSTEDQISLDILSNETQFDLLSESSCKNLSDPDSSVLSEELGSLGSQLSYMEQSRGTNDPQVLDLKRYYSLLEAKDLVLMEKINEKCHSAPPSIIYFYSNAGDCTDCARTGYVLDELRSDYPALRIYSFDYNLDLSAVKTLIDIYKIQGVRLPALVFNDDVYYGFRSTGDIEKLYPDLAKSNATTSSTSSRQAATSTKQNK